jgi:hypothetical protein
MKLKQLYNKLLLERYVNITDSADKRKYGQLVWNMIQDSYKKIGGYKGATSIDELITSSNLWKLVRRDNKIIAVCVYKDLKGRKLIAAGTDGSDEGKKALNDLWIEDLKLNRTWAEVSDVVEHIKLTHGFKPIPNKYAAEILNKEILNLNPDGIHYTRLIGGVPYEKAIVGKIAGYENIEDFKYTNTYTK